MRRTLGLVVTLMLWISPAAGAAIVGGAQDPANASAYRLFGSDERAYTFAPPPTPQPQSSPVQTRVIIRNARLPLVRAG